MSLIDIRNLSLGYDGNIILKNVSFSVEEGDYICIVGENGSGKTTLVKGLLGFIPSLSGSIDYSSRIPRNNIGYLSQKPKYTADFPASVREVVMSGFLNNRIFGIGYTKREKQMADSIMASVGIDNLHRKSFSTLSGGQQQRVLLARALCATRKLLLLDEPTSALDPVATTEFYSVIKKLNKEEGITIIMVSHDVTAAVRNASHILSLHSDNTFFGTTHEYIHSPEGKKMLVSSCPCDDCSHFSQGGCK